MAGIALACITKMNVKVNQLVNIVFKQERANLMILTVINKGEDGQKL